MMKILIALLLVSLVLLSSGCVSRPGGTGDGGTAGQNDTTPLGDDFAGSGGDGGAEPPPMPGLPG